MANLSVKIPNFIGKAQARLSILGRKLIDTFDHHGYQSADSEDLSLKVFETRKFIVLLLAYNAGGMTEKEIDDNIDFFWGWLELNKVNFVNYTNYQTPIQTNVIVPAGNYALASDLVSEINERASADSALNGMINAVNLRIDNILPIFPEHFFDNHTTSYAVVFNDDSRLHTHANKAQLDQISSGMVTNIVALAAHYASIGNPSGVHVSTSDRATWNLKISPAELATALVGYAPVNHVHSIANITSLQGILNQMNIDISNMAGSDGREVEFQRVGNNLEWRYVGDVAWISLGSIKGDAGEDGEAFTIDVKADSNARLSSIYDNEDDNFTFLATDTGYLYFRNPVGGSAALPGGWTAPIPFLGYDGWSPHLGLYEFSSGRTVLELVDWIGGEGNKPFLDPGINPPNPVRWFVGPNGYTLDPLQAINVKGPTGAGYGPIIGAVGNLAGRTAHDTKSAGFIYMRNDILPQTIYIKNTNAAADWSLELPWQGPPGVANFPNQAANTIFAGPPSGGNSAPTFRSLVPDDIPFGLQVKEVLVSSPQILSLHTTPVEIIPAPGAGKFIRVYGYELLYHFGTSGYTVVGGSLDAMLHYNNNGTKVTNTGVQSIFTRVVDAINVVNPGDMVNVIATDIMNKNVALWTIVGSLSGGDSTMTVRVLYSIITI